MDGVCITRLTTLPGAYETANLSASTATTQRAELSCRCLTKFVTRVVTLVNTAWPGRDERWKNTFTFYLNFPQLPIRMFGKLYI